MQIQNTTPLRMAQAFFKKPVQEPELANMEPEYDTPPNAHSRILIQPNFLSVDDCKFLVEYANKQTATDLAIFDPIETNKTSNVSFKVNKEVRDTQNVECDEHMSTNLNSLVGQAVRDIINPYFDIALQSGEPVQFLKYGVGGHYKPHPDGEATRYDKEQGKVVWAKNMDRDISILLYLNDEYEGGQLVFPNQHITINPKPGMLVAFPSSHHFIHGVTPVTAGTRYVLVTWASMTPGDA